MLLVVLLSVKRSLAIPARPLRVIAEISFVFLPFFVVLQIKLTFQPNAAKLAIFPLVLLYFL